ncbi:uncharacterized protein CCDC197 isoform X2 [Hemicordylus capensis]|uniref:uncharacterized protein CCDC197 isoform X2 n=1 Tax=Hemicordylus capensis TaxID=884348 RepID=UPI00230367AA|nr:uncharacterized protein CCDC197 isoform X2 [Hemicordylus capensis]
MADRSSAGKVENRRRNVFVTQLGEHREEEDGDVSHIPIVREIPSEILQKHNKTLQKTLLLQKEAEHGRVTAELIAKRQEFKEQMEALARRRGELTQKEQNNRAEALKFDIYLKDCELKKKRAIKKFQTEQKVTEIKKREIQNLKEELKKLKIRQETLHKKVAKYKRYEDFLQKIVSTCPVNSLEFDADSVVGTLMKRHQTLLTTNQTLTANLSFLLNNLQESQREVGILQEEHDTAKIMLISKISELQTKCHTLQEKNAQLEQYVSHNKSIVRNQRQEQSRMLLAISAMAEQCYMQHYGPLEKMTLLSKLDMIQEFILEKMQIKQETMLSDELAVPCSSLKEPSPKQKKVTISMEKL